ncbi:hypothetical protein Dimus_001014 [Dionaea muscipula]
MIFVVLKSSQLKEIVGKMPPDFSDIEGLKAIQDQAENFLEASETEAPEPPSVPSELESNHQSLEKRGSMVIEACSIEDQRSMDPADSSDTAGIRDLSQNAESVQESDMTPASDARESVTQEAEDGTRASQATMNNERAREVIEQFEVGVYVTTIRLRDGTKIFKRVRFSKRRFSEQQAEEWWKENRDRVLRRYIPPPPPNSSPLNPPAPAPMEESSEPVSPVKHIKS